MEDIIQLRDGDIVVSIATTFGNNAYSMTVCGQEVLWRPQPTLEEWRAHPAFGGVPLLAPWANRIDQESYYANGKRYFLNAGLNNLRFDANHLPMHGLVAYTSQWRVIRRDANSVTSRLEYWRIPEWMAQFPFAHTIEITHRLEAGSLEVATSVENLAAEPMPLSLGYHPYFQLTDAPRDEWRVRVPAREHVMISDKYVPTGQRRPNDLPDPFPLVGRTLDDVFSGLTGDEFVLEGRNQRISVRFGTKYPVAIVYAPGPPRGVVCFEPMSALTNAFNLTHAGIDAGLRSIAPGDTWRESFWITPSGF